MPIATWRWTEPRTRPFGIMGPMAQDFSVAFGLGESSTRLLRTVDADGVALAAIQGLNLLLQEKDAKIEDDEAKIAALERRLQRIEEAIAQTTARAMIGSPTSQP